MKILGNGCASSAVSAVLGMRVPSGQGRRFGWWKVWHFAGFDESLACGLRSANGGEGKEDGGVFGNRRMEAVFRVKMKWATCSDGSR